MDERVINNIKSLGIDMISAASSGHPGIVLGASPIIYTVYANHLIINPNDSDWLNRDRFVLSSGHGSAMLYATLYLAGYDFYLDDLKRFRQINSKTPGHPEYGITKGVECSTGPLGEGLATAVGMALGAKKLNQMYNLLDDKKLFDYHVYVLCGDGDLMEGISNEALSIAGNLCLDNLIILYDSNSMSLDGSTNMTMSESVCAKYDSMGFYTEIVNSEVKNIDRAIEKAKKSGKPSIIEVKTTIGQGSLLENTNTVHGKVLTMEDVEQLKQKLKVSNEPFYIDEEAKKYFSKKIMDRSLRVYNDWKSNIEKYNTSSMIKSFSLDEFTSNLRIDLNNYGWNTKEGSTREINHEIMQMLASKLSRIIGGSADVASSTLAYLDNFKDISKNNFEGRNIRYGVRENAMGAISNGLALSYFKPFCSCFLAFSDYLKPSIRMSCLMNLPVTYIFTHDSICVGSDGPTHQPIEQLGNLRSIPNMHVFRPCDYNEVVGTWNYILNNNKPVSVVLSRQKLPLISNSNIASVSKGAYVVRKENGKLHATILATGSEVSTAVQIANELESMKYNIRVVSVPCLELFREQSDEYKESIIPKMVKTFVIEASNYEGWYEYIYNNKYLININNFGYSGNMDDVLAKSNFSYQQIKNRITKML